MLCDSLVPILAGRHCESRRTGLRPWSVCPHTCSRLDPAVAVIVHTCLDHKRQPRCIHLLVSVIPICPEMIIPARLSSSHARVAKFSVPNCYHDAPGI